MRSSRVAQSHVDPKSADKDAEGYERGIVEASGAVVGRVVPAVRLHPDQGGEDVHDEGAQDRAGDANKQPDVFHDAGDKGDERHEHHDDGHVLLAQRREHGPAQREERARGLLDTDKGEREAEEDGHARGDAPHDGQRVVAVVAIEDVGCRGPPEGGESGDHGHDVERGDDHKRPPHRNAEAARAPGLELAVEDGAVVVRHVRKPEIVHEEEHLGGQGPRREAGEVGLLVRGELGGPRAGRAV
mmetsp:Transcript_6959/g.23801  ORF Transcript_6959/g.23801 Transcript_6959/m.23801 type:complete len:243 (+) Transcript_6959:440-1168(+)